MPKKTRSHSKQCHVRLPNAAAVMTTKGIRFEKAHGTHQCRNYGAYIDPTNGKPICMMHLNVQYRRQHGYNSKSKI